MAHALFPSYTKDTVVCFHCFERCLPESVRDSGYNNGSSVADCPNCGMHTFFNLVEVEAKERTHT